MMPCKGDGPHYASLIRKGRVARDSRELGAPLIPEVLSHRRSFVQTGWGVLTRLRVSYVVRQEIGMDLDFVARGLFLCGRHG